MYLHPAFKIDQHEALPILLERGFGQFIVATDDAPYGVHVPFMVEPVDAHRLHVEFHVARANPIHTFIADGCRALLICEAGDAYISPDWYGVDNQVPTWTYVAVHLKGTARVMSKEHHLDHVERLSAKFEQRLAPKKPWTSDKMDAQKRAAMLSAIAMISFDVDVVEAQKKLIQHKGITEHEGAILGLAQTGDHDAAHIAALMGETLRQK